MFLPRQYPVRCDGLWLRSDSNEVFHDQLISYTTGRLRLLLGKDDFFVAKLFDQIRPTIFYSLTDHDINKAYSMKMSRRDDGTHLLTLLIIAKVSLMYRLSGLEFGRCAYAFVLDCLIDYSARKEWNIPLIIQTRKRMRPLPKSDPFRASRKLLPQYRDVK